MRSPSRHRGFALLAVLWIMVGLSALALATNLVGRQAVLTATNRVALTQARWHAEGCIEEVRSIAAQVLAGGLAAGSLPGFSDLPVNVAVDWNRLDRVVANARRLPDTQCQVTLRPTGIALDINAADGDQLRRLFLAVGLRPGQTDSLADAILDWRDVDDVARPAGAESQWYTEHGQFPPRNGPLVSMKELRQVRGYLEAVATFPALDTLLTVEPGAIVPSLASPEVMASLPPVGPEWHDLTATSPDAWIITATGYSTLVPKAKASIEIRLVRAGNRPAVVRRREML